jgi:hypothetical protein
VLPKHQNKTDIRFQRFLEPASCKPPFGRIDSTYLILTH